jgi:glycosyltransferase involved in cell wall biosynthesis
MMNMFCSTIIPTVGRPTLSRAVESVLNQVFSADDFEVIVVNDSGEPLPEADWQRSARVEIVATNRHNRSVARNAGAAVARGRYLHFLDDDDWMLPGAFESLWELASTSHAAWLYGAFRLVDNQGQTIVEVFPEETGNCLIQLVAWEWLPLQASIIASDAFFGVGGFASLPSLLGGFEDIDLSRQIARYHDFTPTARVVACIRAGDEGSTTNYGDMFRQNRQSREKALNAPGSFARLTSSARVSPSRSSYWYGRVVYYYLGSTRWNVQHRRLSTAGSRGACTMAAIAVAGRHILSADFWRGLLRPHPSRVSIAYAEAGVDLFTHTRWRL